MEVLPKREEEIIIISSDNEDNNNEIVVKSLENDHHDIVVEKTQPKRVPLIDKTPKDENDCRPYKCDQCTKEYTVARHLARHRATHKQQFCADCNVMTTNIVDHMHKIHGLELPRLFECDTCHKRFRTKECVQAHKHIHQVEKRIVGCTLCSKTFFFNAELNKHMISHSEKRSAICDICGDAFKTVGTLTTHMRRHTGETPYKCTQCPKAFTTGVGLKIHQQTHTGQKPYECSHCQKHFSDSSTLQVHQRQHTNDSPYQCHLCDRRTKQASNLKSHYKYFHKNQDITSRQIRLNSRIFGRFEQSEIDAHFNEYGDLRMLLDKGLAEFNREEKEKKLPRENEPKLEVIDVKSIIMANDTDAPFPKQIPLKIENATITSIVKSECDEQMDTQCSNNNNVIHQMDSVFIKQPTTQSDPMCGTDTQAEGYDYYEIKMLSKDDIKVEPEQFEANNCDIPMSEVNEQIQQDAKPFIRSMEMKTKVPSDAAKKKLKKYLTKGEEKRLRKLVRQCKLCDKRSSDLKKHTIEAHSVIERPFQCYVCEKTYKEFNRLRYHLRRHSAEHGDFVCHLCGGAYFLYHELARHIYNHHENIRPFKCEECGKCFKLRYQLHVHGRKHSGEKPFNCLICLDKFSTKGALKVHSRVHSGDKPFACGYCKKSFSVSSTRRQHERTHSGAKPYRCHLCDRCTTQSGNLKSHYRHYHKVIVKHVAMFKENSTNPPPIMVPVPIKDVQTTMKGKLGEKKM